MAGMKTQGALIRKARHDAGMTQAALAAAAGTRERNIIRWENNQHEPRFDNIVAIAEATGKPLEFFADDDEEAAPVAAGSPLTPAEFEVFGDLLARIVRPKVATW